MAAPILGSVPIQLQTNPNSLARGGNLPTVQGEIRAANSFWLPLRGLISSVLGHDLAAAAILGALGSRPTLGD
jgi:hypothetical protein